MERQPLKLDVVSADRMVWQGDVVNVIARTSEGDIGILPGHEPLMAALTPCMVEIVSADGRRESWPLTVGCSLLPTGTSGSSAMRSNLLRRSPWKRPAGRRTSCGTSEARVRRRMSRFTDCTSSMRRSGRGEVPRGSRMISDLAAGAETWRACWERLF